MLGDILFAFWFFLPAGIANATPVLAAHIPLLKKLDQPMDFGRMFRGKRIFGTHKTWRGLITGMLAATLVLWWQQIAVQQFGWAQSLTGDVDYAHLPVLLLGPLFGFGALAGDAIESFFKRQHNVKPGHGWFPFDQTDYIIGGAIATMPFVTLSIKHYAWLLLLWLALHVIVSYIGYLLKLKARPISTETILTKHKHFATIVLLRYKTNNKTNAKTEIYNKKRRTELYHATYFRCGCRCHGNIAWLSEYTPRNYEQPRSC